MDYGKRLLDRAAAKAGSRYALSKLTGLPQSHLSEAANGKRDVPASWVLPLARVAEVDPTEALEMWDLERAEKKRLRRLSSRLAAGGVAAICAIFASSGDGLARAADASRSHARELTAYASYRLRRLMRLRPSAFC